jgi:hypothetical protein
VTKKDGVVVSDEFFHNSTYNGKAATIKRNTSGVVITTEAATEETSPAETTAAESTETETSAAPTTAAPTQASVPNGPGYVEESSSASYGPGDPVPTTAAETTAASPAETTAASPIAPISPADTPAAGQTETSSGPGDVGTILPNG